MRKEWMQGKRVEGDKTKGCCEEIKEGVRCWDKERRHASKERRGEIKRS